MSADEWFPSGQKGRPSVVDHIAGSRNAPCERGFARLRIAQRMVGTDIRIDSARFRPSVEGDVLLVERAPGAQRLEIVVRIPLHRLRSGADDRVRELSRSHGQVEHRLHAQTVRGFAGRAVSVSFHLGGYFAHGRLQTADLAGHVVSLEQHASGSVVVVESVSRPGSRGQSGLFLQRVERRVPVPSFHEFAVKIGMLQAHPGAGRNHVDGSRDSPGYLGEALLAERYPLPPQPAFPFVPVQRLDQRFPGPVLSVLPVEQAEAGIAETELPRRSVIGNAQVVVQPYAGRPA